MFEIRLPERENFRKLAISRLTKKNIAHMNNITFKKDLLGVQDDLLRLHTNLLPTVKKPTTSCRKHP